MTISISSYPAFIILLVNVEPAAAEAPPVSCGVNGGTGLPPESSDGVFDKNKFPPNSETNVIGELHIPMYHVMFGGIVGG